MHALALAAGSDAVVDVIVAGESTPVTSARRRKHGCVPPTAYERFLGELAATTAAASTTAAPAPASPTPSRRPSSSSAPAMRSPTRRAATSAAGTPSTCACPAGTVRRSTRAAGISAEARQLIERGDEVRLLQGVGEFRDHPPRSVEVEVRVGAQQALDVGVISRAIGHRLQNQQVLGTGHADRHAANVEDSGRLHNRARMAGRRTTRPAARRCRATAAGRATEPRNRGHHRCEGGCRSWRPPRAERPSPRRRPTRRHGCPGCSGARRRGSPRSRR